MLEKSSKAKKATMKLRETTEYHAAQYGISEQAGHGNISPSKRMVGGSHYLQFMIQPVEFITRNKIPYMEACAIKYLCRWRAKNGRQDLQKAQHYIELLIEMYDAELKAKEAEQ